jgi:small GTP-binding protein
MVRLKIWQWVILATPLTAIIVFLIVAAGLQIHEWRINWIWAVFPLLFLGWRWLLVRWTKPGILQVEAVIAQVNKELESVTDNTATLTGDVSKKTETALQQVLQAAQHDTPMWQDWSTFWQRCQNLVVSVAHIYHPEVKYPLLNIYVPQAYGLIRGTIDDMDAWMQKLSPALNQATIGQAYQAYEVYQRLEPSARKFMRVWGMAQWILNPAAALAKRASQSYTSQANQQLLVNLGQLLRESALRNLCKRAVLLYSGSNLSAAFSASTVAPQIQIKAQTLRDILAQAEPVAEVEQKPVNILLVGRTGAGKSSLINTLFNSQLAEVDVLPSTDQIQSYHWRSNDGETLTLWDTPGYEQVNRSDLVKQVLEYTRNADLLLLVTPALDPSLQMDTDFLKGVKSEVAELPSIAIVTQVDKLRPVREWQPPYDWQWGEKPKEVAIREATQYRAQQMGDFCDLILPVVTADAIGRNAWNADRLSLALVEAINPAKQQRLARFLRDLDVRSMTAAKIIDNYTFQMATAQGFTALLKSPVLQFISTVSTGSPTLAYLLAEKIPAEQLPLVLGKLQMAYELFSLLNADANPLKFDMLAFWSLLLENSASPDRNASAFGQALVEYWTQNLTAEQLRSRFDYYLRV